MKCLARSYVWWPALDRDIEQLVRSCPGCNKHQSSPTEAPLHPWEWPTTPWYRVHVDFAGPFQGFLFLIIIDAHSKWPEVIKMKTATSTTTANQLRTVFARYGLPKQLVSDGASIFTSREFEDFMKSNSIKHIVSPPYHPQSNGQAERFVRTFKDSMKAANLDTGTLQLKMDKFLLRYRNTPHSTTKQSPAELFLGRPLRSVLDSLKPDLAATVADSQATQVKYSSSRPARHFSVGDEVWVRDFTSRPPTWVPGTVFHNPGTLTYLIDVGADIKWRRHVDHIRRK